MIIHLEWLCHVKLFGQRCVNQLTILRRYARNLEEDINIDVQIANIKSVRSHIGECMRVSELMGYEGLISRLYFEALGKIVPSAFAFTKRTKQRLEIRLMPCSD